MSNTVKAVLLLAEHKLLKNCLLPYIDREHETIAWNSLGYHGLSGGQQTAISWAYAIWTDEIPPSDCKFRDPFAGFGSLDRDLQQLILTALAVRHGTYNEPGELEKALHKFGEQMRADSKK